MGPGGSGARKFGGIVQALRTLPYRERASKIPWSCCGPDLHTECTGNQKTHYRSQIEVVKIICEAPRCGDSLTTGNAVVFPLVAAGVACPIEFLRRVSRRRR